MKDSTKLWLVSIPFLLIGLAVVLTPLTRDYMARQREERWKIDPLTMQITVSKATEASSSHRTKFAADMLVFEIGLLRLVMPAVGDQSSSSSGGCEIATTSTSTSGGSSGSSGWHQYSHRRIPYGSKHEFTGPGHHFQFDVRRGCLCLGDQRICIVDTPKLVVLEPTGEIKSVTELSVSHPPLKGSAGDVAALIDRAQKYAKVPPAEALEDPAFTEDLRCKLQITSATEAISDGRWNSTATKHVVEWGLMRLILPSGGMPESSSTHPPFSVATSQLQDEVEFFLQRKSNPSPTAPHNYQRWRAGCSVHHVFSGPSYKYTFDIIQGCLCIKGQRVCIVDKPKLVILDQSGSIKSVRELTVDYPKPTGKPEDIAALVKSAQKFADRFQKN